MRTFTNDRCKQGHRVWDDKSRMAEFLIFFCFLCKKNGHRKRRINNGLKGIKAKTGWERDTAIGKELKSPFQTDYISENKGDPQTRFQWYLRDLVNSRVDGRVKTGKRSNSQKNCQLIAKSSRLVILVLIQGKILEHVIKWLLCELWEGEETITELAWVHKNKPATLMYFLLWKGY